MFFLISPVAKTPAWFLEGQFIVPEMCQIVSGRYQMVSNRCMMVSEKCQYQMMSGRGHRVQEGVTLCQEGVRWCQEGVIWCQEQGGLNIIKHCSKLFSFFLKSLGCSYLLAFGKMCHPSLCLLVSPVYTLLLSGWDVRNVSSYWRRRRARQFKRLGDSSYSTVHSDTVPSMDPKTVSQSKGLQQRSRPP